MLIIPVFLKMVLTTTSDIEIVEDDLRVIVDGVREPWQRRRHRASSGHVQAGKNRRFHK